MAQPEPVQSVASVVSEPPRPKVKVDVNERSLAEYILSLDGTVTIEDSTDSRLFISRADQLPQVCRVVQVGLSGSAKVHDESFAKLAELKAIEKRWLGQTAITNTSLKLIGSLATLESLNVEETKITESGLPHIARLTNLRDLRLDVPLSDAGLAELKPLRQLKQFSFVGGKVTDFGLGLVCETFPELTHVVTDQIAVTDAGLAALSKFSRPQRLHRPIRRREVAFWNRTLESDTSVPQEGVAKLPLNRSRGIFEKLLKNVEKRVGNGFASVSNSLPRSRLSQRRLAGTTVSPDFRSRSMNRLIHPALCLAALICFVHPSISEAQTFRGTAKVELFIYDFMLTPIGVYTFNMPVEVTLSKPYSLGNQWENNTYHFTMGSTSKGNFGNFLITSAVVPQTKYLAGCWTSQVDSKMGYVSGSLRDNQASIAAASNLFWVPTQLYPNSSTWIAKPMAMADEGKTAIFFATSGNKRAAIVQGNVTDSYGTFRITISASR